MPFTPFAGISTIVHLLIIAWHKCVERIPDQYLPSPRVAARRAPTLLFLILGSLIIISMFAFVISTAAILIYSSSIDEHSSFHLVPKIAEAAAPQLALIPQASESIGKRLMKDISTQILIGVIFVAFMGVISLPRAVRRELMPTRMLPPRIRVVAQSSFGILVLVFSVIAIALLLFVPGFLRSAVSLLNTTHEVSPVHWSLPTKLS